MDQNTIPSGRFPEPKPAESLDPRQALALREWMRLSKGGQPPRRKDFRPERIAKALPVSALVGVERRDGRLSFRQKIEGKMIALAFGEGRGYSYNESFAPDHLTQSLPAFGDAVRDGRVTLTAIAARTIGGSTFDFTRLLLPFTDAEGRVTRVLAVYGLDTARLMNLRAPLRITADTAASGAAPARKAYLRLKTA